MTTLVKYRRRHGIGASSLQQQVVPQILTDDPLLLVVLNLFLKKGETGLFVIVIIYFENNKSRYMCVYFIFLLLTCAPNEYSKQLTGYNWKARVRRLPDISDAEQISIGKIARGTNENKHKQHKRRCCVRCLRYICDDGSVDEGIFSDAGMINLLEHVIWKHFAFKIYERERDPLSRTHIDFFLTWYICMARLIFISSFCVFLSLPSASFVIE